MKYLIALILFFCALISQGQGQNKLVTIIDEFDIGRLSFKTINQKIDTTILVDGSVLYLFEFPGANADKTKGRFIIQWVPMGTTPPVEPIMIDNLANLVVNSQLVNLYTTAAQWIAGTPTGHYNNTVQFSSATNSTLVTKFTGTKIEWIHEMDKHLGIAAISIDNGPETLVDTYNPTNLKQQSKYTSPVLTQGLHTVKLRVTGTKNPAATGVYLVHDAWKVTP